MATTQNLDSVTAATRLRRDTVEIQQELDEKRSDYQRRMDKVKEQEERLKGDRSKLQDTLVQYYKYIQDNELKRSRANKKAAVEEKAKHERFGQIKSLRNRIDDLEGEKLDSRSQYQQLIKYQKYLEEVLQFNESEEYQDPKDIIKRFEMLDDNKRILQRRKTQLEEDLARNQSQLQSKTGTNKSDTLQIDNNRSEAQGQLEKIQQDIKNKQDMLESTVAHRTETTKTIGQVRMACQNLYDRCTQWNSEYNRTRSQKEASSTDVIHQLTVIGDCLGDYTALVKRNQERIKERQLQAHLNAANGMGGLAALKLQQMAAAAAQTNRGGSPTGLQGTKNSVSPPIAPKPATTSARH
eukprot:GILI01010364.1.p1 GENE.GILI01010364.1~~GILI01010364.1.p1  ORF type:complete len:366 (+),score=73.52 GILI01010364.1:42-1100(+)